MDPSNRCFNCGSGNHFSKNCNLPQKFSRCAVCKNVCTNDNSHKVFCTNKTFVSQLLDPETIAKGLNIEFSFKGVRNVSVIDRQTIKKITTVPLFVVANNSFVYKREKRMICSLQSEHAYITFIGNAEAIMSIELNETSFIVNGRYRFGLHGTIEYYTENMGTIGNDGRGLRLKLDHSNEFAINIIRFGEHEFKGFENGVLFMDPLVRNLRYPQNANGKL